MHSFFIATVRLMVKRKIWAIPHTISCFFPQYSLSSWIIFLLKCYKVYWLRVFMYCTWTYLTCAQTTNFDCWLLTLNSVLHRASAEYWGGPPQHKCPVWDAGLPQSRDPVAGPTGPGVAACGKFHRKWVCVHFISTSIRLISHLFLVVMNTCRQSQLYCQKAKNESARQDSA